MHHAPSVSYPVGRSRFHAALLALIVVLGALTVLGWVVLADAPGPRHAAAAVLLWQTSSALALWQWWRVPAGVLVWDGSVWTCTQAGASVSVVPEVALDLQAVLLLQLHANGRGTAAGLWVWPERHTAPLHWRALRRAVFALQPLPPDAADLPVPALPTPTPPAAT